MLQRLKLLASLQHQQFAFFRSLHEAAAHEPASAGILESFRKLFCARRVDLTGLPVEIFELKMPIVHVLETTDGAYPPHRSGVFAKGAWLDSLKGARDFIPSGGRSSPILRTNLQFSLYGSGRIRDTYWPVQHRRHLIARNGNVTTAVFHPYSNDAITFGDPGSALVQLRALLLHGFCDVEAKRTHTGGTAQNTSPNRNAGEYAASGKLNQFNERVSAELSPAGLVDLRYELQQSTGRNRLISIEVKKKLPFRDGSIQVDEIQCLRPPTFHPRRRRSYTRIVWQPLKSKWGNCPSLVAAHG